MDWIRNKTRSPLGFVFVITFLIFFGGYESAFAQEVITVNKGSDTITPYIGDEFIYYLNYECSRLTEPSCNNVVVTDSLPPEVEFVSNLTLDPAISFAYDATNHEVTYTFTNPIPDGTSGQLAFKVRIPTWAASGGDTITNEFTAEGTDMPPNTSDPIEVTATYNTGNPWGLSKYGNSTAPLDTDYTYLFGINDGGSLLTNAVISDVLPIGVVYVGCGGGDSCTYDATTNTVSWNVAYADGWTPLDLTVQFPSTAFTLTEQFPNTGCFSGEQLGEPYGSIECSDHWVTISEPVTALNVSKWCYLGSDIWGSRDVPFGQEAGCPLRYENAGDLPIQNAYIIDQIPSWMDFTRLTTGRYNYTSTYTISYEINNSGIWVQIPLSAYSNVIGGDPNNDEEITRAEMGIAAGDTVTGIRVDYGTVPVGFYRGPDLRIFGTMNNTVDRGDNVQNCFTAYGDDADPDTDCGDVNAVGDLALVDSSKWVRGEPGLPPENHIDSTACDITPDGFTRYPCVAQTLQGGQADYRVVLGNIGTISMTDIVMIDILPHLGDVGVKRFFEARDTEWVPVLTSPISTTAPVAVTYSTECAPCRAEVDGPNNLGTDCTAPNWTATPANYADVCSLRFDFGSAVLYPGDQFILEWNMTVPVGTLPDEVAWNSIAHVTTRGDNGTQLLPAEPRKVGIETTMYDFGDLPAIYGTTGDIAGTTNPVHVIHPGIYFGSLVDAEDDGQPSVGADGDDLGGSIIGGEGAIPGDDEDGIIFLTPFTPGQPASIEISAHLSPSLDGFYGAWFDFNGDGDFNDPGEIIAAGAPIANGSTVITFTVSATATLDIYSRFRIGMDATEVSSPIGFAASGEVEDYVVPLNVQTAQFGDRVWIESDIDGLANTGVITPVMGMVITATDGINIYTTTTDANGYYSFTVPAGTFTVTYGTVPGSYGSVIPSGTPGGSTESGNAGASYTESGNPDQSHTNNTTITVAAGEANWHVDFAFTPAPAELVSIGSTLFYDNDDSGIQDSGELGIPGIVVELYSTNGVTSTLVATMTTDTNGDYYFGGLLEGDYQVVIPTPPATAPTSSTDIATSGADNQTDSDDNGAQTTSGGPVTSPVITLTAGAEPAGETGQGGTPDDAQDTNGDMTIDFGFVPEVSIGSTLFYDNDDSGIQDSGELGIPGIVVELYSTTGVTSTLVATMTTDSNGDYFFGGLLEGDYQVVIPTPPATAPTSSTDIATSGADNQTDSDDNGSQTTSGGPVTSPVITLTAGSEPAGETGQGGTQDDAEDTNGDMTVDFGFVPNVPLVSLGSTLFYDNDDSGVQDSGEMGIPGIVVELYSTNGVTSTLVATMTTDSNGDYFFGGLLEGDYQVVIPTPPAAAPTSSTDIATSGADNQTDSDDNGSQTTSGGPVTSPVITLRAGAEPAGETGQGGTQDDAEDTNGDMTVDFGFVPNMPLVSLGSTLFYDNDDSGMQDSGEMGIPGIVVELYDAISNSLVATTTTDTNGDYYFGGLLEGDYQVVIPTPPAAAPTSSTDIATSGADNQTDSDDNGSQTTSGGPVTSPVITLTAGAEPAGETGQGGTQDDAEDTNGDMTVDFGFVPNMPLVSLGSTLFYDNDDSGVQDSGEMGIPGIVVELYDAISNSLVATMTTDTNGDYYFGGLLEGDYQVVIPTPPAAAPTSSTDIATSGADNQTDSDDNGSQTTSGGPVTSPVITLTAGAEPAGETGQGGTQDDAEDTNGDMTVDFGFVPNMPLVSLGSTLFYDNDDSGVQDSGEMGIPGIVVELYDAISNSLVATMTTDTNGDYYFGGLLEGDYQVVIPTPPAAAPTSSTDIATSGADNQTDSDDNGSQTTSGGPVTSPVITLTAGAEPAGETGQGGTQDDAEDTNGDMTVDFGFVPNMPLVSLGSTLFYDNDDSGVQDSGEMGIPGIVVELYDAISNSLVATMTTDTNGDYYFGGLLEGDYQVVIPTPPAAAPTSSTDIATSGADNQTDSDDNGSQTTSGGPVTSPVITLTAGAEPAGETGQGGTQDDAEDTNGDMTVDFGFVPNVPLVSLGSTVFFDNNDSGTQDAGEIGIPGIVVELYDSSGNLAQSATTDSNGDYFFGGLLEGDYTVVIPTPPAAAPTSSTDIATSGADNQTDSDDNGSQTTSGGPVTSPVITLTAGSEPAGETGQGGTQDDAEDTNGDMTVDFGFVPNMPLVSLGSTVFFDNNDSGTQDAGEIGIPGIVVELYDSSGNLVQSVTTDANGDYFFGGLLEGDYTVVIPTPPATAPTSSTDIATSGADNQTDSDDNGSQTTSGGPVTSPVITLMAGAEPAGETGQGGTQDDAEDTNGDMTVDFGFVPNVPLVSLGSTVFFDNNDSGTQDAGEIGIPGIVVELYDSSGNLVQSVATDANGDYFFGGLLEGDYTVVIPTPPATAPTSSTDIATSGADNQTDSDDNGSQTTSGGPVTSPVITLTAGSEPAGETGQGGTQDDADDDNGDMTVDFGFVPQIPAAIGDYVWFDLNADGIQDSSESGIPGVVVTLYDGNGNVNSSTATGPDGLYLFDDLPPGEYYVEFTPPPGYLTTTQDSGSNDATDSDMDPQTFRTVVTTLLPGERDMTWDAGFHLDLDSSTGALTLPSALGDLVWLDANADGVQDAGELGVPNVTIHLLNSAGQIMATTQTDATGNYLFPNLVPGSYGVQMVPPPAYNVSPTNFDGNLSENRDSDANTETGRIDSVTLVPSQTNLDLDMGIFKEKPTSLDEMEEPGQLTPRIFVPLLRRNFKANPTEVEGAVFVACYERNGWLNVNPDIPSADRVLMLIQNCR